MLDALPAPADPAEMLADAARDPRSDRPDAVPGPRSGDHAAGPRALAAGPPRPRIRRRPLLRSRLLPPGAEGAWTFVRGKDLSTAGDRPRPRGSPGLTLRFADPELRRPVRFPIGGQRVPPPSGQVAGGALELRVASPGRVAVLGLDRPTAAERQGVAEKVTVSSEREIPVEEILRRLQAFEDAQNRRLNHYSAINTTRYASSRRRARRRSRRRSRGLSSSIPRPAPTGPGRRSTSTASAGGARRSPRSR